LDASFLTSASSKISVNFGRILRFSKGVLCVLWEGGVADDHRVGKREGGDVAIDCQIGEQEGSRYRPRFGGERKQG
jgi:hypothetical protein